MSDYAPHHRPPLERDQEHKMVAGVCAGLGRHLDIDPVIFRIALTVLTLFGGLGILAYAAAWLLIPAKGESTSEAQRLLKGTNVYVAVAVAVAVILVLGLMAFIGFVAHTFNKSVPLVFVVVAAIGVVLWHRESSTQQARRPVGGRRPTWTDPAYPADPAAQPQAWWQRPVTVHPEPEPKLEPEREPEPEQAHPDVASAESPAAKQPEPARPEPAQHESAHSDSERPASAPPAPIQPTSDQPASVQPVSEWSASAPPAPIHPVSDQPASVQPDSERPGATPPAPVQSWPEQPESDQPDSDKPTSDKFPAKASSSDSDSDSASNSGSLKQMHESQDESDPDDTFEEDLEANVAQSTARIEDRIPARPAGRIDNSAGEHAHPDEARIEDPAALSADLNTADTIDVADIEGIEDVADAADEANSADEPHSTGTAEPDHHSG